MDCDVAKARCEVSARECRRRELDLGGGLLSVPGIKWGCPRQPRDLEIWGWRGESTDSPSLGQPDEAHECG